MRGEEGVEDALRTDADMQLMLALLTIPVLGVAGRV